jgi:tripartite-type tricarboxylate transporter receptor subunit TctC
MNLRRRQFLHLAAGAAALPTVSRLSWAQTYPARPVTMVVPFPAGGPTDAVGRVVGERMQGSLGQRIVVENVSGAGGTIALGRVARAPADGYTICVGDWSTHVASSAVYTPKYDLLKDFEPISLLARHPQLIVSKKAMPAKNLLELITWLKANPDKAAAGTSGVGAADHVSGILFQNLTGTRFQFIPYRGVAPAMQDLVSGQIDIKFDSPATSLSQVRAGTIRAYAVSAKARLATAPEIPTVDEAGLAGFYASNWRGLWAPKGTLKDVVLKLNAAVVDALNDPAVRSLLVDLGQEIPPRDQQTPEALGALQKAEIEKWWPIIKDAGIKAE